VIITQYLMKLIIRILFFFLLLSFQVFGQILDSTMKKIDTGNWLDLSFTALNEKGESIPLTCIEEMPIFPGGFDSLAKFIGHNLNYPKSAIDDKIQGRVLTTFQINEEGKVVNVETYRGIRHDLDSACYHVVSILPRWTPCKHSLKTIIFIKFLLPINFVLTDSKINKP